MFEYRHRKESFSSPKHPEYLWGPINITFNGYVGVSSQVIRPGRDVDTSVPSNTEVQNKWNDTSIPWTEVA